MNPKQRAAEAAIQVVRDGMVVGLGTGSTADFFLIALGTAIRQGKLRNVRGVPTSRRSEARALELGIPLTSFADVSAVDVTIDGADEVDPSLNLIKGLGGALLREKIVAQNSRRLVIIADTEKLVPVLGTRSPLPVEVATFGHESQAGFLRELGAAPVQRRKPDGSAFLTDNGNYIYDCKFPGIEDPAMLDAKLARRAGVVESGLFIGIADTAFIGADDELQTLTRHHS